jgi:hypothetical protein
MRILFLTFFIFSSGLFALTPFSLESLSSVNFKILNKNKALDEKTYIQLSKKIEEKLHDAGIQTQSKSFANLLLKIQSIKLDKTTVYNVSLTLVEDVSIPRDEEVKAIAITFSKSDFFETTSPKEELLESIDFLLDDFLTQHKEEN